MENDMSFLENDALSSFLSVMSCHSFLKDDMPCRSFLMETHNDLYLGSSPERVSFFRTASVKSEQIVTHKNKFSKYERPNHKHYQRDQRRQQKNQKMSTGRR